MTTLTSESYVRAVAGRLTADGCAVHHEDWNGTPVLIGRRADFRIRWMVTKLHLVTIVAAVPAITREGIEAFTGHAMDYAKQGVMLGMQSGVAVFPALVGTDVDPAASAWAAEKQRVHFACMGRPVVVDLVRSTVSCYRATPALGFVYAGHLRKKLDLYFPPTASL
jgi:hypothetical protein